MTDSNNPLSEDFLSGDREALLALLLQEEGFDLAPGGHTIPRRDPDSPAPLSFAQQRLWFLDQLQPGNPAYNFPVAVRLWGLLQPKALFQSLGEIVRRHEALRTSFSTVDEQPIQVIQPAPEAGSAWPIPVVDLSGIEPGEALSLEARARQLTQAEAGRPFDLAVGPLFRASLLRLGPQDHLFLLVFHHIIFDGWSQDIFFQELSALYGIFSGSQTLSGSQTGVWEPERADQPSPLTPLPIQYADFAAWQQDWLKGEVLENQLNYWRRQLGGPLPILRLPTDHPRPPIQTYRGATRTVTLPPELSEALRVLSQQTGITLFITLLAAFKALLYRYTGQTDLLVGTPLANRNRAELEDLIGFFVNTLVLRTDLSGNPTGWELLERVREVALNAYAHQDLPFEQLVEALHPERDLSHQPLFQVMFGLQSVSSNVSSLSDLNLAPIEVENDTAQFDLSLYMEDRDTELIGTWEYNTDLFEVETITRMIGHWQTLLAGLAAQPGRRLSELPLLTALEKKQIVESWNETSLDYPRDRCLPQLFEAQVDKTAEAVAVVFEGQQLTYRDLNEQANRLAHYLQSLEVGPGVLVGLAVERSLEMAVGLLGILKAGGAYVPLDPAFPQARLSFMLADARIGLLLTQASLVSQLPSLPGLRLICLDEVTDKGEECGLPASAALLTLIADREAWQNLPAQNPTGAVNPELPAYVIYTSGSTGQPKGVQIPHRALANFLNSMRQQPGLTEQDILLAVTTLSFDIAGLELFLPLIAGARVVIAGREVVADGPALARLLAESGITVMQATPATWQLLLASGWQEGAGLKILCGGEALPHALANQLLTVSPSVWNLYGPTETTIWSAATPVEPGEEPVSIGRPIANTQLYILDSQLQPVPVGIPGELYIGGEGLAHGYLHRPALTAERFIPHPFAAQPGLRLYRTGDLARYSADGRLEILGRVDHQVKVRGFRIELEEIETALNGHPGVRQAVLTAWARDGGEADRRLVAYFTPALSPAPTSGELRAYLAEKLPEYMLPSLFIPLESWPLTPNGKVDRKALPVPAGQANTAARQPYLAPRDPLELQLSRLWETILEVRPVGVKDNFFELGGHSLLAVRLMAQIKKRFGQDVPLAALFQNSTVEHLARILRRQSASLYQSPLVEIQRRGTHPPFYCVHPADGTVLSYLHLARYLGPQQPFYGLQSPVTTSKVETPARVEEMAAGYIGAIQMVQPQGSYLLGGWSLGGVIALEMAQQLQAAGQEVALLALFDSWAPPYAYTFSSQDALSEAEIDTQLLADFLADLRGRFAGHLPPLPGNFGELDQAEQLHYVVEQARLLEIVLPEGGLPQLHELLRVFQSNSRAVQNYRPRPYAGKMVLLRAGEESAGVDPSLGWASLTTGSLEIYTVPGNHYTILAEPYVQTLAERLRDCFNKVINGPFFSS